MIGQELLLGGLVFGAVVFLVLSLRGSKTEKRSYLAEAIAPSYDRLKEIAAKAAEEKEKQKAGGEGRLPWLSKLEEEALQAGIKTTAFNLLTIAILGSGAIFTGIMVVLGSWQVALGASLLGLMAPRWWIGWQKKLRAEAFAKGLDRALILAASTLRAGASLSQAIERVGREAEEPIGTEFRLIDAAIKMGMTPPEAIELLKKRVDSPEVNLFVAGSHILFRAGGNLAEVYESISEAIRQHRNFRQMLNAYTAQARLSATVISLVPIFATLFMRVLNPQYFDPMLASPTGAVLFYGAFAVIGFGWIVIRRMVDASSF